MRQILLIRHAIAEDHDIAKPDFKDEDRALTKTGRAKMAKIAHGLKAIVPDISYIASSPLLRAVQTADILHREYRDAQLVKTAELQPGLNFHSLIDWLRNLPATGATALVGHEPDLSYLLCRLLTGKEQAFLHFKKGGASLIELGEKIAAGDARLMWLSTPGQLRRIGAAE